MNKTSIVEILPLFSDQPLLIRALTEMLTNLGHIATPLNETTIQLPHNNLVLTLTGHKILVTHIITYGTLRTNTGQAIHVLEIENPEFQEELLTIINSNC